MGNPAFPSLSSASNILENKIISLYLLNVLLVLAPHISPISCLVESAREGEHMVTDLFNVLLGCVGPSHFPINLILSLYSLPDYMVTNLHSLASRHAENDNRYFLSFILNVAKARIRAKATDSCFRQS